MTVANLGVAAPGRPDAGTELDPDELDDAAGDFAPETEGPARPVTVESVKGLVLAATETLHRIMATNYPERPEIALMTDAEAERVAGALVSMASRNAGLRRVLERSDIAVLMVTLAGYTGRVTSDMAGAKRERRAIDDSTSPLLRIHGNPGAGGVQGPGSPGGPPAPGRGSPSLPGDSGAPGGAPGIVRPPAPGGGL